jgi:hypothetical protein
MSTPVDRENFAAWNEEMVRQFNPDAYHNHPSPVVRMVEALRVLALIRVEQGRGVAAGVVATDSRTCENDVILLGVLAQEANPGRGDAPRRPPLAAHVDDTAQEGPGGDDHCPASNLLP